MTASRADIEFMFQHFKGQLYDFPRRITTLKSAAGGKIKSGGQFPVNSIDDILSAYKRAEDKECRLSAYPFDSTEEKRILPDVIFIDIDNHEQSELNRVLRRMKKLLITSSPTINDSGRGHHIIQPVDCSALLKTSIPEWFTEGQRKGWSGFYNGLDNELQGFYTAHLGLKGQGVSDVSNNPTTRSCLLRVPGTTNVKVNKEVTTVQEWDGKHRPSIELILGDFFFDRLQKYNKEKQAENERIALAQRGLGSLQITDNYYDQYIPIILKSAVPDWREHIISLVIVPYLLTVKQLPEDQVYSITENWLRACDQLKPLVWDYSEIWKKIRYTRARKRRPMGKARLLCEMSIDSPEGYAILQQKLNVASWRAPVKI